MIEVTAAIIEMNGLVMAARRKEGVHLAGLWEFPGGKVEAGESPEECLARELEEEFRIRSQVGAYIGESTYDYGAKVIRLLAYKVEHLSGRFELVDHDELRWLALAELDTVEWAPADIPLVEQYRAMAMTAAYYDGNATAYCEETSALDVGDLYKRFLAQLDYGAHILDLGCGSGRDSKAFLDRGYNVTAVDGSAEIAACAEQAIGQPVAVTTFQELAYTNHFDGVWACASLLHCPRSQILDVLGRVALALKAGGVAYLSFKWGEQESVDEFGRYFNNYTQSSLQSLLDEVPELSMVDLWTETTPLREGSQQWVNALVRKGDKYE